MFGYFFILGVICLCFIDNTKVSVPFLILVLILSCLDTYNLKYTLYFNFGVVMLFLYSLYGISKRDFILSILMAMFIALIMLMVGQYKDYWGIVAGVCVLLCFVFNKAYVGGVAFIIYAVLTQFIAQDIRLIVFNFDVNCFSPMAVCTLLPLVIRRGSDA